MSDEDRTTELLDPAAGYRLWASSYPPHAHNPLMRAEERGLLSLLPENLRGKCVLDAGCGTGRYLLHALRRGARWVAGVDQSPEMLERAILELSAQGVGVALAGGSHAPAAIAAQDTGLQTLLLQASLNALPLPDRWFDHSICALSLGHLSVLRPALAELRRVTKLDGSILCSDFHPIGHTQGWQRTFKYHGRRFAIHHVTHSSGDWQRACSDLGLSIETVLEPRLDPADIPGDASFDTAALSLPVVVVYRLLIK